MAKMKSLSENIEKKSLIIPDWENQYNIETLKKQEETLRVCEEIIINLDDKGVAEMFEGSENDLSNMFDIIYEESYMSLFGDHGKVKESSFHYLDSLYKSTEETLRIENINYFILSTMPEFKMNWHHLEWGNYCMLYNRFCVIAARDHGKSYFFSNAYPIWKMYRYQNPRKAAAKINPRKDLQLSERGFLITNEMDLSKELLEIMRDNIEGNDLLRDKLYPGKKDGWGKESIKCKNGAKFGVKSYGGSFRGRHPGYIVVDDFLRENVIYSSTQRSKSIQYFHATIMNALVPGGQIPVVGTPMHEIDLYGDLKSKPKAWRVFEYPAIFPDGTVLWDTRYDLEDLLEDRESQGTLLFSREKLVRPIVSESSLFPYKTLKKSLEGMEEYSLVTSVDNFPINFVRTVTGCDFAISANVGADFSVFTTWGIDEREDMWLLNMWRKKGASLGEQLSALKSIHRNFRPDVVCMESNQMQAIFGAESENEGLPVYPHHTGENKYNFKYGLPSLTLLFERKKMHIPYGDEYSKSIADMLLHEFSNITWTDTGLEGVGAHDDIVMSSWKGHIGSKQIQTGFGVTLL